MRLNLFDHIFRLCCLEANFLYLMVSLGLSDYLPFQLLRKMLGSHFREL